jgi:hypothetical protein
MKKKTFALLLLLSCGSLEAGAQRVVFDRDLLPQPVFHSYPGLVDLYWLAWQQAWDHVKTRPGLVQERYMDEGFWEDTIWLWDTEFMALFCKYAPRLFPGIETLDNFYYPILEGRASPLRVQHPDNPPFLAWVESEYYRFTGDTEHVRALLFDKQFLQRYFDWFDGISPATRLPFEHQPVALERHEHGYKWSGVSSGMDNTPRGRGDREDLLWVDAISQQALSALYIARLATGVGHKELAREFQKRYERLKAIVNKFYWDEEAGTYVDVRASDLSRVAVKTPAAYWAMLAEIPTPARARRMAALARDTSAFGGRVPWVSVSRDDPDFNAGHGDYWRGGVWLPTAYVGIKALEKYGFFEEANESAYNLLLHQHATFMLHEPRTIWECYSPTSPAPGMNHGEVVRPDFCGWSALGPISLFIENVLGFYRVDARARVVEWRKHHRGLHGIKNLSFGNITTDIIGDDHVIQVETNEPFTLVVNGKSYRVRRGSNTFK